MKSTLLMAVSLVALMSARMRADIIYSGLKDVVIPPDFTGVYLDVDTGVTGNNDNSPPAGWDVNPFFGGAGIANSPSFQPARLGNGTTDPILALSVGELISNMLSFSTGYGGSEGHMETEYVAGEEAYLAFQADHEWSCRQRSLFWLDAGDPHRGNSRRFHQGLGLREFRDANRNRTRAARTNIERPASCNTFSR
jgi:hypothetical protein